MNTETGGLGIVIEATLELRASSVVRLEVFGTYRHLPKKESGTVTLQSAWGDEQELPSITTMKPEFAFGGGLSLHLF